LATEARSDYGRERAAQPRSAHRLQANSLGLPQVLFQSITTMAPAASITYSLFPSYGFAGAVQPLGMIFAVIVAIFVANSIGQLGREIHSAGGLYAYATGALGPYVGFWMGWVFVLLYMMIFPGGSLIFALVVQKPFNAAFHVNSPWWVWVLAIDIIVFALAYWGVKLSANVSMIMGAFEIAAFLALAIFMIVTAGHANTTQVFNPANAPSGSGWSGVFKGMVFSILAIAGFEAAAPLGEEARNPRRIIPIAVIGAAIGVGLVYIIAS
jgi:amino acid transporter